MYLFRLHRKMIIPLLLTLLLAVSSATAFAQDMTDTKDVGIVIRYSDGTVYSEIVTVPADATAFDVLEAANIEMVSLETSFGPAVCKIGDDGNPADDCFGSSSSWGYWHLEGDEWVSSETGVGGFTPEDGAVEGFAWTAYDENFNAETQPPVITFAGISAGAPAQLPVTGGASDSANATFWLAAIGATALAAGGWLRHRSRRVA